MELFDVKFFVSYDDIMFYSVVLDRNLIMFILYYGLFLYKVCRILIGYILMKLLYYCFIIRQEKLYSMIYIM